jgi:hypothetical protein
MLSHPKVKGADAPWLLQVPEERLSLPDAVRMAVYAATQQLAADNERLRMAAASSREAAARLEPEAARLQRDNTRLAAALVRGRGGWQARCGWV